MEIGALLIASSKEGAVLARRLHLVIDLFEKEVKLRGPPTCLLFHVLELLTFRDIHLTFVNLIHGVVHIDTQNDIIQGNVLINVVVGLW